MRAPLARAPPRGKRRFTMAEEKTGFGKLAEELRAKREANVEQRPKLAAELAGMWRQGREDAFNNLVVAFPQAGLTREQGAPGTPTPHAVDRSNEKEAEKEREGRTR